MIKWLKKIFTLGKKKDDRLISLKYIKKYHSTGNNWDELGYVVLEYYYQIFEPISLKEATTLDFRFKPHVLFGDNFLKAEAERDVNFFKELEGFYPEIIEKRGFVPFEEFDKDTEDRFVNLSNTVLELKNSIDTLNSLFKRVSTNEDRINQLEKKDAEG